MKVYDLLKKISTSFNSLNIPYFVTGSIASIAYGESRFTNDIDIVADIQKEHIPDIIKYFPEEEYYISEESMKNAIYHNFQFNIIHPTSGLKVDVVIKKKDDFDDMRFSRTNNFEMDGVGVNFAAPEDVLIMKMKYYKSGGSEKHIRDIMSMVKISNELIDFSYIELWVYKLNLKEIWEELKNKMEKQKRLQQ